MDLSSKNQRLLMFELKKNLDEKKGAKVAAG